jgi:hypothetical protein
MRAAEVMRQLRNGPGSLAERSAFMPGGAAGEEARKHLLAEYQLWVSTWILPELEDLVPELRAMAAKRLEDSLRAQEPAK